MSKQKMSKSQLLTPRKRRQSEVNIIYTEDTTPDGLLKKALLLLL